MIQTTIRLPDEIYQQIKDQAKSRGLSVNGYLISVLCEKRVVKVAERKER